MEYSARATADRDIIDMYGQKIPTARGNCDISWQFHDQYR